MFFTIHGSKVSRQAAYRILSMEKAKMLYEYGSMVSRAGAVRRAMRYGCGEDRLVQIVQEI